jgi:hypothetical protein
MTRKHLNERDWSISNRQVSAAGIDHNGKGDSAYPEWRLVKAYRPLPEAVGG